MSALTPEAARAAAAYLETLNDSHGANLLCAKADRLEAAAKTPGQVLAEVRGLSWAVVLSDSRKYWEEAADAVIAHVVGPGRVVVDRDDLVETLRWTVGASFASDINKASTRLREALS